MNGRVIAVDVGGTTMKGAVFDAVGAVQHEQVVDTHGPGRASVDTLRDLCRDLQGRSGGAAAAGVVVPGLVDEIHGVVAYASNVAFRDLPLRDILSADLGVPVGIGHDGRAAGLAEAIAGSARGCADFLHLPIGTGISAAIVRDGRCVPGATFAAGEVGHMPVFPGGELCPCGQRGCLEAYASASGIARRYAAAVEGPDRIRVADARGGEAPAAPVDSREVGARRGTDPQARRVWQEATDALGYALTSLTLALDPGIIVIGGGLAQAGEALLEPVREALRSGLAWREPPPVVGSGLGPHAARLGAAILARQAGGLPVPDGWGART